MNHRVVSLVEVGVFYALSLGVIWSSPFFRPPVLLVALILIGVCVSSNRFHRDSLSRIGLTGQQFWPALKSLLPVAVPLLILMMWMAIGKSSRDGWNLWFVFLGYPFWGLAQEYALLGFVANRLEDGFPDHIRAVPWINGFLFSMAHLPNPLLMGVTFVAGVLFTKVFLRNRDLYAPALVHAVFGVVLSLTFSSWPAAMMIGPTFLKRL